LRRKKKKGSLWGERNRKGGINRGVRALEGKKDRSLPPGKERGEISPPKESLKREEGFPASSET